MDGSSRPATRAVCISRGSTPEGQRTVTAQYLLYLVIFTFALIVIFTEDHDDDDDQDGGILQPVYSQGGA